MDRSLNKMLHSGPENWKVKARTGSLSLSPSPYPCRCSPSPVVQSISRLAQVFGGIYMFVLEAVLFGGLADNRHIIASNVG